MAPAISAATQCTSPMMQDNQESPQKLTQPGTGTIPVHTQSLGQVPRVAQSNPPRSCSHLGTQTREAALRGAC